MSKLTALLTLTALLSVSLAGTAVTANAKKGKRTEERSYVAANGIAFPAYTPVYCLDDGTNCSYIPVHPGERFMHISAEDVTGAGVALAVFPWDSSTTNPRFTTHHVCTATDKPIPLPSWVSTIWVEVLAGPCSDGTPAAGTTGTMTATFMTSK